MNDNDRQRSDPRDRGTRCRALPDDGLFRTICRSTVLGITVAVLLVAASVAHAVETLEWKDLAPPDPQTQNPFRKLPPDQQANLYQLFVGQFFAGESKTRSKDEQQAYDALKKTGADPDAMLANVVKMRKEAEKRDNTLLSSLDKKVIKLPGYVLPVDFKGTLVKTFLLVPYVGACIHVPPPPPNQIVYVEADKPFKSEELFAPVWVTGPLRVGKGAKNLELVDGANDVNYGYSLKATRIDPYEQQKR